MSKELRLIKRTSHKRSEIKGDYEVPIGKSMTVQDDAMTVQELLRRMTEVKPTFDREFFKPDFDDPDLEKIHRADVNTQMRIHKEQLEKVKKAKKTLEDAENERVKREKEAEKVVQP